MNNSDLNHHQFFPLEISGYKFLRQHHLKFEDGSMLYGIYQDALGKLAFAKMAKVNTLKQHWLKNEAKCYKWLNSVILLHPELKTKLPEIKILKLIAEVQTANYFVLLLEYTKSVQLSEITEVNKIQVYRQIFAFFTAINNYYHKNDNLGLEKRSPIQLILIFLFTSLFNLIKYPRNWQIILQGWRYFIGQIPDLIAQPQFKFIHRDLSDRNILYSGKQIIIIDFELSLITHPAFEYINLLIKSWTNPKLTQQILVEYRKFSHTNGGGDNFKPLAIYSIFYDMIYEKSRLKSNLNFLNYILNSPLNLT
jgi:thiamine kinase-like enzyme